VADTNIATGHALTIEQWSAKLTQEMIYPLWFVQKGLVGTNGGVVIVNKDLTKTRGDTITFPQLARLTGSGIYGAQYHRGNEEALAFNSMSVVVNRFGHTIQCGDLISQQRTNVDLDGAGQSALSQWGTDKLENRMAATVFGLLDPDGWGLVNTVTPSTNRMFYIGQTVGATPTLSAAVATDAALAAATQASYQFGTKVINYMKRKAQDAKIEKIRVEGGEYYVIMGSHWQIKALYEDGEWVSAQHNAANRGSSNPLFTGMAGIWNGCVIHEYERTPFRENGQYFHDSADLLATADRYVARAALLGQRAVMLGWAKMPTFGRDFADYDQQKPVRTIDSILGMRATQYTDSSSATLEDYGRILVDTQIIKD